MESKPSIRSTVSGNKNSPLQNLTIGLNHVCVLPKRENIVVHYIQSGRFVSVRRKFRQMLIISDSNPLCKIYMRSSSTVHKEQTHHMHYHYYMIHPFSNFQRYWELFMLAILTLLFIVIPLHICCHNMPLTIVKLILDCCTIAGVISTFWTGFLNRSTNKIVMNKKLIARRYIFGYFIVDCVTSSTIFMVVLQAFLMPNVMPLHNVFYVKLFTYLKLFRFITWLHYLECFRQWRQLNIYKFKIIKLFLYYCFTIWWCACILYVLQLVDNYNSSLYVREVDLNRKLLINCVYHAVYIVFSIGSGEQATNRYSILLTQIITLIIGNVLYIYTIAQIMDIVRKSNLSKIKDLKIKKQIGNFLEQNEIPEHTRRRVMLYFNFKYKGHFFAESSVLHTLNKNLRQEIFLHLRKDLVLNANFFKVTPSTLMDRIVSCMKTKIYLCNDLIVQAGTTGSDMFFIHSGTVAVYTPNGREVCHLTEGTNFGEVSLIYEDTPRVATVIAIDIVEMFTLSRQDFNKALQPFPHVYENMRKLAEDHIKKILISDDEDSDLDDNTNDITINNDGSLGRRRETIRV